MDTSHDNVYDMNGENDNPVGLSEERIRLIYRSVSDIKHLQTDVDNLKDVKNSMTAVKNDMVLMNKGVHADMASLKSSFTAKLDATTTNFDLQMNGLKETIKKNSGMQKLIIGILVTLLLGMPGTLLFGVNMTNKTQLSFERNMDRRIELFITASTLKDSLFESSIIEIKTSLKGIKESIKK